MRNTRNLVLIDDAKDYARAMAEVPPHQNIVIQPSGLSGVTMHGTKCAHGVYIPATSLHTDYAPYCSLCHPYEIAVREGAIYKA